MTVLLEREGHLQVLERALGEAAHGRGRVAALTGEAGIGKTALAAATVARACGERVFRGACEDLSVPAPLGPLQDLAREAGWSLEQAIGRHDQRPRLFSEALRAFDRPDRPTCWSSRICTGRIRLPWTSCASSVAEWATAISCCS